MAYSVRHLNEFGPALGFPHSSKVTSFRYPQMRELRTQSGGRPLRTLYAFNPLRKAILLIGGEKTGDDLEQVVDVERLGHRRDRGMSFGGRTALAQCRRRGRADDHRDVIGRWVLA